MTNKFLKRKISRKNMTLGLHDSGGQTLKAGQTR